MAPRGDTVRRRYGRTEIRRNRQRHARALPPPGGDPAGPPFAALTAAGAQIEIPNSPVPFTLQTLFVLLSGALLGPRLGTVSMLAYLGAGAAGLPVFSSFGFGVARLLGPTGGYLLAFPAAAFVAGSLSGSVRPLSG